MLDFIHEYRDLIESLGKIAAAITAIYIVYIKVIRKPVCNFCDFVHGIWKLPHKIEVIYDQLTPNSGKSLRDTVKRIEDNQILLMSKHRIIVDDYITGIIETDEYGNITWANATYLELVNRDLRDVLGNGWVNSICSKDRDRVYKSWRDAFDQKRAFEEKFCLETLGGESIKVHAFAYPISASEIVKGYIGKFKVILEEKTQNEPGI